jgi:hypothetical protein
MAATTPVITALILDNPRVPAAALEHIAISLAGCVFVFLATTIQECSSVAPATIPVLLVMTLAQHRVIVVNPLAITHTEAARAMEAYMTMEHQLVLLVIIHALPVVQQVIQAASPATLLLEPSQMETAVHVALTTMIQE